MNCPHCKSQLAEDARFCGACGKVMAVTESDPRVPVDPYLTMLNREVGGRYRIIAKLGEGGMGAVFRAEQISLKRTVAVKVLRPEVALSSSLLRRFNAEAEVVAKLSHPNTVNIFDFGQDSDGTLFIAMEFIDGRPLRQLLQAGPLPVARALAIAHQITESLADAHAHAIIHRDLKPDNVMLQERGKTRDIVRVLDFGIAKLRDETRATALAMTQAGDMLGTPQYMAPEQIKGETIDGRTDVYALGCMLYEMVTGRMPYEADAVMAILSKHLLEPAIPPSQRRPDLGLSAAIDQLVLDAMAKNPRDRPPTMEVFGEMIAALAATLAPSSVTTPIVSAQQPAMPTPVASYANAQTAPVLPAAALPLTPIAATIPVAPTPVAAAPTPAVKPVVAKPVAEPKDRTTLFVLIAIGVLCVGGLILWRATSAPEIGDYFKPNRGSDGHNPFADKLAHAITGANATLPPGATINDQKEFLRLDVGGIITLSDFVRGVEIVLFPMEPSADDGETLARAYAVKKNLEFQKLIKVTSHGADRDAATFTGTNPQGKPFIELVIAYIMPTYRVALSVTAPVALANSADFQHWLQAFVERDVVLP
jgi:serine/threonine protein kinase